MGWTNQAKGLHARYVFGVGNVFGYMSSIKFMVKTLANVFYLIKLNYDHDEMILSVNVFISKMKYKVCCEGYCTLIIIINSYGCNMKKTQFME